MKNEKNLDNLKLQLGLFNDEDNVIKSKGRLGNAQLFTLSCCQEDIT